MKTQIIAAAALVLANLVIAPINDAHAVKTSNDADVMVGFESGFKEVGVQLPGVILCPAGGLTGGGHVAGNNFYEGNLENDVIYGDNLGNDIIKSPEVEAKGIAERGGEIIIFVPADENLHVPATM